MGLWAIILVLSLALFSCRSVDETVAEHFVRDYLGDEEPNLHGVGLSYEELGTLWIGEPVIVGVRNEICQRRIEEGVFVGIDMRAYACNTDCRAYRAVSVYDRATVLPYHSIFRGITYEQLMSTPFINAELYIGKGSDTVSIPLWQVDAIVPVKK
jgi:hypothetical protein